VQCFVFCVSGVLGKMRTWTGLVKVSCTQPRWWKLLLAILPRESWRKTYATLHFRIEASDLTMFILVVKEYARKKIGCYLRDSSTNSTEPQDLHRRLRHCRTFARLSSAWSIFWRSPALAIVLLVYKPDPLLVTCVCLSRSRNSSPLRTIVVASSGTGTLTPSRLMDRLLVCLHTWCR
jgi:hypothetical protein